jgi:hypothetical protein
MAERQQSPMVNGVAASHLAWHPRRPTSFAVPLCPKPACAPRCPRGRERCQHRGKLRHFQSKRQEPTAGPHDERPMDAWRVPLRRGRSGGWAGTAVAGSRRHVAIGTAGPCDFRTDPFKPPLQPRSFLLQNNVETIVGVVTPGCLDCIPRCRLCPVKGPRLLHFRHRRRSRANVLKNRIHLFD